MTAETVRSEDTAPQSPFPSRAARQEERDRKREAILLAAVRMFNERGFHATSLDDVAASLGVTKPVVYHYLGNKDQVLFECLRIGLSQMMEAAETARALGGDGITRLESFLRCYAVVNMEDFGRCVIRTGDEVLVPESRRQFRALKRQIDDAMRAMIEDAANDGSAVVEDIRFTSFAIAGALNWPARWHQDKGPLPAEAIAASLVAFLLDGLRPR